MKKKINNNRLNTDEIDPEGFRGVTLLLSCLLAFSVILMLGLVLGLMFC